MFPSSTGSTFSPHTLDANVFGVPRFAADEPTVGRVNARRTPSLARRAPYGARFPSALKKTKYAGRRLPPAESSAESQSLSRLAARQW